MGSSASAQTLMGGIDIAIADVSGALELHWVVVNRLTYQETSLTISKTNTEAARVVSRMPTWRMSSWRRLSCRYYSRPPVRCLPRQIQDHRQYESVQIIFTQDSHLYTFWEWLDYSMQDGWVEPGKTGTFNYGPPTPNPPKGFP